jgi:hypothetical protein
MNRHPWGIVTLSAGLLAGCEQPMSERAPIPPIDASAPTTTETATFALG